MDSNYLKEKEVVIDTAHWMRGCPAEGKSRLHLEPHGGDVLAGVAGVEALVVGVEDDVVVVGGHTRIRVQKLREHTNMIST